MHAVHLRGLDLNLLVLFHAVFTEQGVSAAAQRLGMSQSALSHGLSRLRETFQDELFVRSGLAMMPTRRALELYEPIREIIDNVHSRILPAVSFDPTKAVRQFTIGGSDAGEIVFLPTMLRHFSQRFPGCTIHALRLGSADIPAALETGAIELAIGSLPERPQHFYEQVLYHHDYAVIAWNNHPRLGDTLSQDDYLREQHIVVASGTDQHLVCAALAPHGWKRNVVGTVGGFLGLPWLLIDSEWIATVPRHVAQAFEQRFPIRRFSLPVQAPPYPITSHWHPRSHHDPGHRWMRQFVFDLLRRYPDLP